MSFYIDLTYKNKRPKDKILSFGLKWDQAGTDVNVNLFAIQVNKRQEFAFNQKVIYYNNLKSKDPYFSTRLVKTNNKGRLNSESITANQEIIISDLDKVPDFINRILYCVASPDDTPFRDVNNCYLEVIDLRDDLTAIHGVDITNDFPDSNACILYEANKVYPDRTKQEFNWELNEKSTNFTSGMYGLLDNQYNEFFK